MSLTSYGTREITVATIVFVVAAAILAFFGLRTHSYWFLPPIIVLFAVYCWSLAFFRDPDRTVPQEPGIVVSPADGTVTHLDMAEEPDFIGGQSQRCSIFLSIFNVHLNRAPAAGKVAFLKFRPGAFFDARSEDSLTKNQNQDMGLDVGEPGLPAKMVVRQSSGAIARTIVCPVTEGDELGRGQRYGMIKFGSRTTLFMSPDVKMKWLVKVGDKVKAGETVLARAVVSGGGDESENNK